MLSLLGIPMFFNRLPSTAINGFDLFNEERSIRKENDYAT
jgi:hypothetical protein